jgi:hypothetical protein
LRKSHHEQQQQQFNAYSANGNRIPNSMGMNGVNNNNSNSNVSIQE